MIVTPEMCRLASKSKKIKITSFDENLDVSIEFDVITWWSFKDGQAVSSTIGCTSGQIKHYTFETLMQRVKLTYNYGTKELSNRDRKKFQSLLMQGGCETPHSTHLHIPGILQKVIWWQRFSRDAKMLHYPLTRDQKQNQFFFLSEFNDTAEEMNIKLKVFAESYELYGKPERLYKTNFQSLWITKVSQFQVNYEQKNIHLTHISFRLTTLARFLIRL